VGLDSLWVVVHDDIGQLSMYYGQYGVLLSISPQQESWLCNWLAKKENGEKLKALVKAQLRWNRRTVEKIVSYDLDDKQKEVLRMAYSP